MTKQVKKLLVTVLSIFNGEMLTSQDIPGKELINSREERPYGLVSTYAGGTGLISTGVFFTPFRKTEASITVGYVPPPYGDIITTNLFLSHTGVNVRLSGKCRLRLFEAGAFANINYGDNLYVQWPERYPKMYYWWNSAIRFGPFVNQSIWLEPTKGKTAYALFLHCNTNDLYLASFFRNQKTISVADILVLGAGLKIARVR